VIQAVVSSCGSGSASHRNACMGREATLEVAEVVEVPPAMQALMLSGAIALLEGDDTRHSAFVQTSLAL